MTKTVDRKLLGCSGKAKHASYDKAVRELRQRKTPNLKRHNPSVLHIYRCEFCGHYHIGHDNLKNKSGGRNG